MASTVVWTIGHSGHASARLVDLLAGEGIRALVDVRSAPASRHHPQHAKRPLTDAVEAAGITYVFLGRELGGRPDDPDLYDGEGRVRYDRVAATEGYAAGVERLVELAAAAPTAILCAEEDPAQCHRRLLVGRTLRGRGLEVRHIRGDGSVEVDAQLSLFD